MQQNHMSSVFLHRDEGMSWDVSGAKRGQVAAGRPQLACQAKAARSTCPILNGTVESTVYSLRYASPDISSRQLTSQCWLRNDGHGRQHEVKEGRNTTLHAGPYKGPDPNENLPGSNERKTSFAVASGWVSHYCAM